MKNILKGWSTFEIAWLTIFTAVNIYLFFAFDDTLLGLVTSLTGMLCVVLVAKGRISNYFFGIINTALYAYISYKSQLYGESMLNAFFYFPIQFIGFYLWNKNKVNKGEETVVKAKRLDVKGWVKLAIGIVLVGIAYGIFLDFIGAAQAGVDAFAVTLSITAQILMLNRFAEQWILWIIVNVLSIILWANVFFADGNSVTLLVMWSAYLVNSVYGYIKWLKLSKGVNELGD